MSSISERCTIVPAWDMTNQEWLQARQWGIGGSEIGAIAGLSKYESRYSIWARKVHNVSSFDGNEATNLGHLLEPSVALAYAQQHNAAVVEWPVILRSKEFDFLSANVDRFIVEPSDLFPAGQVTIWKSEEEPSGILGLLECKTGALASPGSPYEWFVDGLSIPDGYACQGYWYMGATGLPWIEYACLLGGYGMQYRHMDYDENTINNLINIGYEFWNSYVVPGIAPDMDGSDATDEAVKAMYPTHTPGKSVEGGAELATLSAAFEAAKAATKEAEAYQKEQRAKIVALIGDAESATVDGEVLYTFKQGNGQEFFADKVFKEDHPDLYAKYLRQRDGFRTLRLKK